MEKELIMNLASDVNFLLTVTGISLLLSCLASVIAVGYREDLKDLKNKHNNLTDIMIKVCDNINLLDAAYTQIADAHNKLNDHHMMTVKHINEHMKTTQNNFKIIRDNLHMAEDLMRGSVIRLNNLEDHVGVHSISVIHEDRQIY